MTSRGRFAPSPTGALHIGAARTALVAWARARASGSTFVMRVEDVDGPRVKPGSAAAILNDLRWLGIDWDEGPDVGGPFGPYEQSARTTHYEEALQLLEAHGWLYRCSCSRKDIEAASSAPHGDEGPIYPGTCQNGPRHPDKPLALRFALQKARKMWPIDGYQDGILGKQNFAAAGDFVVRRADGYFGYHFACAFDDRAMRIEEVVRGADLVPATLPQMLLWRALDHSFSDRVPLPTYAHVPLVENAAGQRMAKRDSALGVDALRKSGISAEQLLRKLVESLVPIQTHIPRLKMAEVPAFLAEQTLRKEPHRWSGF